MCNANSIRLAPYIYGSMARIGHYYKAPRLYHGTAFHQTSELEIDLARLVEEKFIHLACHSPRRDMYTIGTRRNGTTHYWALQPQYSDSYTPANLLDSDHANRNIY